MIGPLKKLLKGNSKPACGNSLTQTLLTEVNAYVASGGWVPMGQGAATAIHPKAEEHPQAYQPATQPRAPPRPAPHYSTRHTEARCPVEVKWTNPWKNK